LSLLIALDIGTSMIKVALFAEDGRLLALASRESPIFSNGVHIEHDALACWNLVVEGIREVVLTTDVDPDEVLGVSVASQGQTFLPVDIDGKPLTRAIVWLDQRAREERSETVNLFGQEEIYRRTGLPTLTPGNTCCALLWLRKNKPKVYKHTHKFLHISDYIIYRFTNRFVGEVPIYSCMGIYDLISGGWWLSMLDFIELSTDKLPDLIEPGVGVGRLAPEAARETGLCVNTLVVSGTLDVTATALGSNTLRDKQLALSLGTTMQTNLTMDQFKITPDRFLVWFFKHILPQAYVGVLWRETAGFTLRWFRDHFYQHEACHANLAGNEVYDMMTDAAAKVPPGSEGLLVLPHLRGTQIPESCPEFKGIFFGITPAHQKEHFVRAILEGIGYSLRENIEIYVDLGWDCREIWATGGGAKSRLWNQINADITGRPQYLLQCNEAASLGAAILASIGTGIHSNVFEACERMVKPSGGIQPDPDNQAVYESGYQLYKKVYQRSKDLFSK
jgi:sugar (pentulose or hexulose) kinase